MNNLFDRNVACGIGGGAINVLQSLPTIVNNTFYANWATEDTVYGRPGNGGAIILRTMDGWPPLSGVKIINNIFYDNNAFGYGESIYADERTGAQIIEFCVAWSSTGWNDWMTHFRRPSGVVLGVDTSKCLLADPLFDDLVDFRLCYTPPNCISPCIDRGANAGATPYEMVPADDIEYNARPVDLNGVANYGPSAYCDIGAYEIGE